MLGFPGPQKLKEIVAKINTVSINYSFINSCIVQTYDLAEGEEINVGMIALYLADVCTLETFPVLGPEDQGKANEVFADIFPEVMDELMKE
jgi:hypothetical protein